MKKNLLLVLCLALLFTGCGKSEKLSNNKSDNKQEIETKVTKESSKQEDTKIKSEEEQEKIINEFNSLMEGDVNEQQIIKFVDDNVSYLSKENASQIVLGIEEVQKKNLEKRIDDFFQGDIQERMSKEFDYRYSRDNIEDMKDAELKEYLLETINSGYKLIVPEGSYYPIQDYEIFKKYSKYVTDDVKDYIDLRALESNEASMVDAAIVISFDELFDRAIKSEEFIDNYPNYLRIDDIKQSYLFYVGSYLYGGNNTPAFDYMSNELNEIVKESYKAIDLNNQNSRLVKIIKEYLPILEANDYKLTDKVQKYRIDIMNKLKKEIE